MNAVVATRCLDALEAALHAERAALLAHDINALMAANEQKLAALAVMDADTPAAELQPRIFALSALNRANGALLARRRREVDWALRHLGRTEAGDNGYDAQGKRSIRPIARPLASA